MSSRTIVEVELEITETRASIRAIVKGGQSYMIGSGGSTRSTMQAKLKELRKLLLDLNQELATLNNPRNRKGFTVRAGW